MRVRTLPASVGAILVAAVAAGPAQAATIKVDDNNVQCKTAAYTSIQPAIDAAAPGDTISVCAGTYVGQLEVDKPVKLVSATRRLATIKAPAQLSGNETLVNFKGSYGGAAATLTKFVIDAETLPAAGNSCAGDIWGIRLVEGAKATITDNEILNARPSDDSLLGCQYGIAVAVGGFYGFDGDGNVIRTTGTGTITKNEIHGYDKLGLYIDGPGTVGTARFNTITGDGCVDYIAQNGIQLSRGAKGTIASNVISDNCYTGSDAYGSGILDYKGAWGSVIGGGKNSAASTGNQLTNNDIGLDIEDTQKSTFGWNVISGSASPIGEGIFVGSFEGIAAVGNKFYSNTATGNDQLDCDDTTTGGGTAGTGNTWSGNHGDTSSPAGICTPNT